METRDAPKALRLARPAVAGLPAGCAFTGLVAVRQGFEQALEKYLTELGTTIGQSKDIQFDLVSTVHFCRWVLVPSGTSTVFLAFETNYDGDLKTHLGELIAKGAKALHRIYGYCEGYPLLGASEIRAADTSTVVSFLRAQATPLAAFHVAVHKKTAKRIGVEAEIRDAIGVYLDEWRANGDRNPGDLPALYDGITSHLERRGLLASAQEPQPKPPPSAVLPWLARAAPLALVVLPFLLPLWIVLRVKESTDEEDAPMAEPPEVSALTDREDFQVQNQLTHVVDVKPGIFRSATLRLVLYLIDLLAHYQFNQGALGDITTIHFARWVLIDNGKRLLFFSNYDGSWESYLGDFIDKAAVGLTAVWSNTKGFPRAQNLVQLGARDEERFKSWTRSHQIPTQLWYSAYPTLTVRNIKQNAYICKGISERPATPEALLAWLQLL